MSKKNSVDYNELSGLNSFLDRYSNTGSSVFYHESDSKFDKNFNWSDNPYLSTEDALQENRGQEQNEHLLDKWANSGLNMGVLAGTTFADGIIGTVVGLGNAASTIGTDKSAFNAFIQNPFTEAMVKFQESTSEALPVYYTKEQADQEWYEAIIPFSGGATNFWADKVMKNAGFAIGAMGAAAVTGNMTSGLLNTSKTAKTFAQGLVALGEDGNNYIKLAKEGVDVAKEVADAAKTLKIKNFTTQAVGSILGAQGEARFEGLNSMKEFEQIAIGNLRRSDPTLTEEEAINILANDKDFQQERISLGNQVFGANLALLTTTNALEFGKFLTKGYNPSKFLTNNIAIDFEKSLATEAGNKFTKSGFYKGVSAASKNFISEGPIEEMGQAVISKSFKDYHTRKYDNKTNDEAISYLTDFNNALSETYGTAKGWEEGVIGGISGVGMSMATGEFKKSKEASENTKKTIETLNTLMQNPNFKTGFQNLVTKMSIEKDKLQSLKDEDLFNYKNLENTEFTHAVNTFIDADKFDDFISMLQAGTKITPEEVKTLLNKKQEVTNPYENFSEDEIKSKISQNTQKLVDQAKKIRDLRNNIEVRFPNLENEFKKDLVHQASTIENVDKRITDIKNNLILSGIPINIEALKEEEYIKDIINRINAKIAENPVKNLPLIQDWKDLNKLLQSRIELNSKYLKAISDPSVLKAEANKAEKASEKEKKEEKKAAPITPIEVQSDFTDIEELKNRDLSEYTTEELEEYIQNLPLDEEDAILQQSYKEELVARQVDEFNNLIINAESEKELDAIIDQLTALNLPFPETLINKKREELQQVKSATELNKVITSEPIPIEDHTNQSQYSDKSSIQEQDRIVDGHKINYATRDVARVEADNTIFNVASGNINENYNSVNAKPNELPVGTKLTLKVINEPTTSYVYENGQAKTIDGNRVKRTLNPSDFTIGNMPIGIYENGKLVGYYPTLDWVNDNHNGQHFNVAESEFTGVLEQVTNFRTQVWNNREAEFETTITDKSAGKLFLTKELLPFNQQQPFYLKDSKSPQPFYIADGNLLSELEDLTNNIENEYNKGTVVQLIPMANGKQLAYPVFVPTLSTEHVKSILDFVEAIYTGKITDEEANKFVNDLQVNPKSNPKAFLEQFIFSQTVKPTKAGEYRIKLRGGKDQLEITLMAADQNDIIIKDLESLKLNEKAFKTFLNNSLYSFKKDKLEKTTKFRLVNYTDQGLVSTVFDNYSRYLTSIVKTNAKSNTLEDGSTIYAGQPVINFDTPTIKEAPKKAEPTTTSTAPVSDIERLEKERDEKLNKEFGRNLELVKSGQKAVISRTPDLVKLSSDPQVADARAQEVIDKYNSIVAEYKAKIDALQQPVVSDKKTNPINWKKGDEIIITVSGRKVSEYKTKIIDINTDGTSFSIQYKDASGNIKTIDNIDETGVFEEPFDTDNGIFRSVELAAITPVSDKKADIEKTLYGTISGSIPLSQALPNGVYTDLGNGLFAYADKNDKIAAIVDRTNGYIVSKSFWNEKQNKWQLPNQANLKDDAKKLGVDEATYIKKYQDAVDSLNKAELAALEGKPTAPVSDVEAKKADIERRRQEELPIINVYWGSAETTTNTRLLSNLAPRKFTYKGKEYGSVEHAYQTLKSGEFDQITYDKYVKAGGYGTKIKGKAVNKDFDNLQLMKDLVVESFKQNPEQAKLLLKYKDFTHTTNEVIDKAFLEGLKLAKYDAELDALNKTEPKIKEIKPVKKNNQVKNRLLKNPNKPGSSKSISPQQRQILENSPSIEALTLKDVDGKPMDFTKQSRIVNLLVNFSSQYFLEGNTNTQTIFDQFFDDFEDMANRANNDEEYTEELEFRNIVKQREKITEFAKTELGKFGLQFTTESFVAKEDNEDGLDVEKGESYDVDNVTKDPRDNVSWQVKLMMNNIYDFDNEDTFMGFPETVPFNTVYQKLGELLKDKNLSSFKEMLDYMNKNYASDKIVEQVISKLQYTYKTIVNEKGEEETITIPTPIEQQNMFFTAMSGVKNNFQIARITKNRPVKNKQTGEVTNPTGLAKTEFFASDRNSAVQTLINEWNNNAKNGRLVTEVNGEKVINKERVKELKKKVDEFTALGDSINTKEALEFIKELFTDLSIDPKLAEKVIDMSVQKKFFPKKGLTKNGIKGLFDGGNKSGNGGNGLIVNIINSLNNVIKSDTEEYSWLLANPFVKDGSDRGISVLARISLAYGTQVVTPNSAKNINKDTYWNFANGSHLFWTLNKLKNLGVDAINKLKNLPILSHNYWLTPGFLSNIEKANLDGLKEGNSLKTGVQRPNMTEAEQLLTVLVGFTSKIGDSYNKMVFVAPTLSDKSNSNVLLTVNKLNLPVIQFNGKKFSFHEDVLDHLKNIAIDEKSRIIAFKKAKRSLTEQYGKEEAEKILKNKLGERHYNGADKFLLFPGFDALIKDAETENEINEIFNTNLHNVVNSMFISMVKDTFDYLKETSLITDDFAYVSEGYIKNLKTKYNLNTNNEVALYLAADLVANYAVNYSGYMGLIGGDIAQFYKKSTLGTYIEYNKRGAKDAAPGTEGNWKYYVDEKLELDNSTQIKLYAKDFKAAPFGKYLQNQFGNKEFEVTNAQEYTTLLEHLNRMLAFEDLSWDKYSALREKIINEEKLSNEDLDIVLQPFKLVYVNGSLQEIEGYEYMEMAYDKTSSFPLIPGLTKDSELDKVRLAMEAVEKANGYKGVSLVYGSGAKAVFKNPTKIWNSDGTVNKNLVNEAIANANLQSREGLRKQQHNPIKKSTVINVLSQMDKLLFDNTANIEFNFNGDKKTGKELRKLKENIRIEQYKRAANNLLNELGAIKNGNKFKFTDINKVVEVLKKEDREGKFSINDYAALTLDEKGNLRYPLSLLNKASEFELFLNSIITNRIIKTKITGTSKIQGTSAGFKFLEDLSEQDKSGIIYTGTYNEEGEFVRKFNGNKLDHLHKNEAGEVKVAQVFLPWKFKGLNMEDFLTPDGKHIDPTKLPEKLLQLIGGRIPNQGHNSQLPIEIAGFLPESYGDLVIVPYEIAVQMGSDFDVDKLYAYMNKHFITEDGEVSTLIVPDYSDLKKLSLDELEQLYKDIHWTILTDPNMTDAIASSLDKDDLKEEIKLNKNTRPIELESPLYLLKHLLEYASQKDAKELVGLFSLGVTHNVVTQGHNLFLQEKTEEGYTRKFIGWFENFKLTNLSGYGISEYNGEKRTTTENLKIGQNAVLDNAKEKIAGLLNLNKITYGVWNLLSRLSENRSGVAIEQQKALSLDYVARFINQPILQEYVKLVRKKQSSLNPNFTKTPKEDAVAELIQKYSKGLSDEEFNALFDIKFNPENLKDNLDKDKFNPKFQLAVLLAYSELDVHAEDWNKIQTTITSDVNGATEDLITASAQVDKVDRLGFNSSIANGASLLGEFDDDGNFIPESQFGWAFEVGPKLSANLWATFYPYNNFDYKMLEKEIEKLVNKQDVISTDFRRIVWNSFKNFLFSSNDLGLFDDVVAERERLMIDAYTKAENGDIIYTKKSLAVRALELKPKLNNLILKAISTDIATKQGEFSTIQFNVGGAKVDGDEYVKAFYDLLLSTDEEVSTFAQDLINYMYINGGTQDATNIIKYIPIEYLNTIPQFSKKINEVFSNLKQNNFIRQFIQNKPRYVYQLQGDLKKILTPLPLFAKDPYPALLKPNLRDSKELFNGETYIPYFAIYDGENKKSYLYEYKNGYYKLIPTLSNEYQFDNPTATSLVNKVKEINVEEVIATQSNELTKTLSTPVVTNTIEETLFDQLGLKNGDKMTILSSLEVIAGSNSKYAKAAQMYLELQDLIAEDVVLKIENIDNRGSVDGTSKIMTLSPLGVKKASDASNRKSDINDVEELFLHEVNHLVNKRLLDVYTKKGNTQEFETFVKGNQELAQTVYKLNNLLQQARNYIQANPITNNSWLSERVNHALSDLTEFASSAYDTEIQQIFAKIPTSEKNKSLLDKLKSLLTDLIKSISNRLGIDIKGSLLEDILETNFKINEELLKWKKAEKVNLESSNNFKTKIDQFNYTYNPNTREIIHNSKSGDKIETNETQINKVLVQYALVNNFPIKEFNNSQYIQINNKILNIANANEVTQEQIKNLFKTSTQLPTNVANNPVDYTNHSGGAKGGDTWWDIIGRQFGVTKHKHYREPGQTEVDSLLLQKEGIKAITLDEKTYNEGQPKATIAARQMGRIEQNYQVRSNYIIRNWAQVKNADAIYAVGTIISKGTPMNNGRTALIEQVKGGTGYAVQMAINEGKPVYVYDGTKDSWFKWNGKTFEKTITPTLTKNFAGIGSRTLSTQEVIDKSYQAIKDVYENTFKATTQSTTSVETAETIYSKLGNKTKSENVIIKSWGELKDAVRAITLEGIISTRIKMSDAHFGNPFTSDTRLQNLIQTKSTKESVERYINWILTGKTGEYVFTGIQPEELDNQREWILEQLKSGELKNKPILYYKELGEPSHATALDYLINKYNWSKPVTTTEVKPGVEISSNANSKYKLAENIYANEQQTEALDKLNNFLNQTQNQSFVLIGKGGTGKTTIIKNIVEQEKKKGKRILGVTVAHQAKKILGKSIGKDITSTLASALAIKLDETTGKFEPDLYARKQGKVPIKYADLVILDETSMVSKELLQEIKEWLKPTAKIIFMGDNGQLPPIGEGVTESPTFNANKSDNEKAELLQRMRQSNESPILPLSDEVYLSNENRAIKTRITKLDKNGNGIIFSNNEQQFLEQAAQDFKKDPTGTKIITYNNEKNNNGQSVKNLNLKIREILWGPEARNQFNKGEIVTAYDSYSINDGEEPIMFNSDSFKIDDFRTELNVTDTATAYSQKSGMRKFAFTYDLVYLKLEDNEGVKIEVPVIANSSKAKYESDLNKLWATDKQLAFKLSAKFGNLQYGYAVTSHKAQGSEYNNVYGLEDNVINGSPADNLTKNKSLYVIITRAKKKLNLLSTLNNNLSPEKGLSFDELPDSASISPIKTQLDNKEFLLSLQDKVEQIKKYC